MNIRGRVDRLERRGRGGNAPLPEMSDAELAKRANALLAMDPPKDDWLRGVQRESREMLEKARRRAARGERP